MGVTATRKPAWEQSKNSATEALENTATAAYKERLQSCSWEAGYRNVVGKPSATERL